MYRDNKQSSGRTESTDNRCVTLAELKRTSGRAEVISVGYAACCINSLKLSSCKEMTRVGTGRCVKHREENVTGECHFYYMKQSAMLWLPGDVVCYLFVVCGSLTLI